MIISAKGYRQLFFITLGSVLLSACESGNPPAKSWEYAVKGTYSAALTDDGQLAAIGSIHHGGSLWRTAQGERLYNWNHKAGEFSNIIATGFSPEGNFALTADHQTMVLWNTQTGSAATFWSAPAEVLTIDLSDNGNYALLGLGDYSAVLFDVKRGGIQRSFYHQDRVRSAVLSNDGRFALTGSEDNSARLWDIQTGQELRRYNHGDEVVTVAISSDGETAFSVAKYDRAVFWATATGKVIGELPLQQTAIKRGQSFTAARFSEDGKQLLTGNSDRQVQLWDVGSQKLLDSWRLPKRDPWKPTGASVEAVSFSNSSQEYLAIASNGMLHRLKRSSR